MSGFLMMGSTDRPGQSLTTPGSGDIPVHRKLASQSLKSSPGGTRSSLGLTASRPNNDLALKQLVQAASTLASAARSIARASPSEAASYQALANAALRLNDTLPARTRFSSIPTEDATEKRVSARQAARAVKAAAASVSTPRQQSTNPLAQSYDATTIRRTPADALPHTRAISTPRGAQPTLSNEVLASMPTFGSRPATSTPQAHTNYVNSSGNNGIATVLDAANGRVRHVHSARAGEQRNHHRNFDEPYASLKQQQGHGDGSDWDAQLPACAHGTVSRKELEEDQYNERFNEILTQLRDRFRARGTVTLQKAFHKFDNDNSGFLSPEEFREVMKGMNLGRVLVDKRMTNMLMDAMDINKDGRVSYNEFLMQLRFGQLPFRGYNPKLRHRMNADPDEPIGRSSIKNPPFALDQDGWNNHNKMIVGIKERWQDLQSMFAAMDVNRDGKISDEEFKTALAQLSHKYKLQLTANEVHKAFADADRDGSRALDYNEFMAGFTQGGRVRFIPEFMKPKALRGSQLGLPWEWRVGSPKARPRNPLTAPIPEAQGAYL